MNCADQSLDMIIDLSSLHRVGNCWRQVLNVDNATAAPSVLLSSDKERFLFNAGEGIQRHFSQHKQKPTKVSPWMIRIVAVIVFVQSSCICWHVVVVSFVVLGVPHHSHPNANDTVIYVISLGASAWIGRMTQQCAQPALFCHVGRHDLMLPLTEDVQIEHLACVTA